ncbi:replication factor C large subunit [Candidatus Woesearchaeota archaeon]|nr:replication factor C large subunit [Candidatus Woesearchaeota archaeon]
MQPLVLKYKPESLKDIKGQDEPLAKLANYVQNYKSQKKKAILIHGPIGCGKTSSIYALAKQSCSEIIEINSSDLRNEAGINSIIGGALKQQSLFFQNKIVLIDEIDNIFGRQDRGCALAIKKLIQSSNYPIILTANDAYSKKLSKLRRSTEMVEFNQLNHNTIAAHLQEICQKENIQYEEKALNTLARVADGDLRGAVIDLQLFAHDKNLTMEKLDFLPDRKKADTIFNTLKLIFKATDVNNSLSALNNVDLPFNDLFLWIDENLPKEYTKPEDLCNAYQKLSNADIFNARIRRQQHWRFLVYISNFLTAGISSSKSQKYASFTKYGPTTRILKLWKAKMKNFKKKDIATKIALKTHSSQKQVLKNFPYHKTIFKNSENQQPFIDQFDFSQEEIDWLNR